MLPRDLSKKHWAFQTQSRKKPIVGRRIGHAIKLNAEQAEPPLASGNPCLKVRLANHAQSTRIPKRTVTATVTTATVQPNQTAEEFLRVIKQFERPGSPNFPPTGYLERLTELGLRSTVVAESTVQEGLPPEIDIEEQPLIGSTSITTTTGSTITTTAATPATTTAVTAVVRPTQTPEEHSRVINRFRRPRSPNYIPSEYLARLIELGIAPSVAYDAAHRTNQASESNIEEQPLIEPSSITQDLTGVASITVPAPEPETSDSDAISLNVLETDLLLSSDNSEGELVIDQATPANTSDSVDEALNQPKGAETPQQSTQSTLRSATPRWRNQSRLNADFFKAPPKRQHIRKQAIERRVQNNWKSRPQQGFQLPRIDTPPRKVPSPTFARFNPGLVSPSPSQVPTHTTTIINNYYGTQNRPVPQVSDPLQMSRCQFKRFCSKVDKKTGDLYAELRRHQKNQKN